MQLTAVFIKVPEGYIGRTIRSGGIVKNRS